MKRIVCLFMGLLFLYVLALPILAQEEGKKEEPKKEEPKKEEPKKEEKKTEEQEFQPPKIEKIKSLEEAVQKAELIFVGIVDYMGEKPAGWGRPPYMPSSVYVRYEVDKFLKGSFPSKKIGVIHEVIQGSKTADEKPGLKPDVFDIDKKVILLLNIQPYGMDTGQKVTPMPVDPDFGAMPWTAECEKKISDLVKGAKAQ